jgi:hypothetical protein
VFRFWKGKKKALPKRVSVVSIRDHTKLRESSFYNHEALITLTNFHEGDTRLVASMVSERIGFNPVGYGLFHDFTRLEVADKQNEYRLFWKTSDSCD